MTLLRTRRARPLHVGLRHLRRQQRSLYLRFEFVDRQGLAEQVALERMAAVGGEEIALRGRLHALGDHVQFQAPSHGDDRLGHHGIPMAGRQVVDEGFVDLELRERQLRQVIERGIAGAKVVEGDTESAGLERV